MNFPILSCYDRQSFNAVCADLERLRTEGHERITLKASNGPNTDSFIPQTCYFPKTCGKGHWIVRLFEWMKRGAWFQHTNQADKVADFTLRFFESHTEWLTGHSKAIGKLLELRIDNSELRGKIQTLWDKVRTEELQVPAKSLATQITKTAESQAEAIDKRAIQKKEANDTEIQKNREQHNAILAREKAEHTAALEQEKNNALRLLQEETIELKQAYLKAQNQYTELDSFIQKLQKLYTSLSLPKTLLLCKDDSIIVDTETLMTVPYFKTLSTFGADPKDLKPTEEERTLHPTVEYFISLKEWPATTVRAFIHSISTTGSNAKEPTPSSSTTPLPPEKIDFNQLLELCELANYLQYEPLPQLRAEALKSLSREEYLQVLSKAAFPLNHPLVTSAIERATTEFERFIAEPTFLHVRPQYLAHILESDTLSVSEEDIRNFFLTWKEANQATATEADISSVSQQVRWEHLPAAHRPPEANRQNLLKRPCRVRYRLVNNLNIQSLQTSRTSGIATDKRKNYLLERYISKPFQWENRTWTLHAQRHAQNTYRLTLNCDGGDSTSLNISLKRR